MKRRETSVWVTDAAIVRWLEHQFDLPVDQIRAHLTAQCQDAAELGAIAVKIEKVRLVLAEGPQEGVTAVVTAMPRRSSGPVGQHRLGDADG